MPIRVNFYGDVSLCNIDPFHYVIDPEIAALAKSAKLNVANLECPLTTGNDKRPYKQKHMKAAPSGNHILELFNAFSLANNHILDYGDEGLAETMQFLKTQQIAAFGAGADLRAAFRPYLYEADGYRLAFFGCSQWHTAGRNRPGAAPLSVRRLTKQVRKLANDGYFVVIYQHWNYEYLDYPAPANRRMAHRLIDAGADLIVGSHPHVVQGYEKYHDRYIFYSLGNFVFDYDASNDSRVFDSEILTIDITSKNNYDFSLTPIKTKTNGLTIQAPIARQQFLERIEQISNVLCTDKLYKKSFYRQAAKGGKRMNKQIGNTMIKQGPMYLISRLHRITVQDLKIRLLALFAR